MQERTLNSLGYALMADDKLADAVAILELVAATYPTPRTPTTPSATPTRPRGRKEDAIRESERAIALLEKVQGPQRDAILRSAQDKLARLKK